MQVTVKTNSAELAEMGLTREQLKDIVIETLDHHAHDRNGLRMDLEGFFVEVEVMPTPAEFATSIREQLALGGSAAPSSRP